MFKLSPFAVSRFLAALAATVALIVLLAAGALTPVPASDAARMVEGFEELVAGLTASPLGIFLNNFVASLLMIIPAAGMALAAFIVYNTGLVISAISTASNIPAALSLLIPFLTFYGFVEMLAYGFAVSESFFLTSAAVKKRFRQEVRVVPYVVAVVGGLLALAAVLEWGLIVFFQSFPT
ncbi:MAG: hypothetical protein NZ570_03720 [Candidatus Caldarchaeum sp.]|nr:hypothetical protein [Candidatus Caldarchaeum sp.]MDW8359235.1 hypothetical protein [Candidatus Caldarchaeum sp.]